MPERTQRVIFYRIHQTGIDYTCHQHEEHEIIFVTSGRCRYRLDGAHEIELSPGYLLAVPAGRDHRIVLAQEGELCGLMFPPSMLDELAAHHPHLRTVIWQGEAGESIWANQPDYSPTPSSLPDLTPGQYDFSLRLRHNLPAYAALDNLFHTIPWNQPGQQMLISNLIDALALLVVGTYLRLTLAEETPRQEDTTKFRILQVKAWIERHFQEEVAIPRLAEMACLSRNHFTTTFTRLVGVSPKQYLLHCRLQHAMMLLCHSALPCKEIAPVSGYADLSNFFSDFKAYTGMTPQAYRQEKGMVTDVGV